MAYIVSDPETYRERLYSGGAINRATLFINDIEIENSNIKSIKISDPIIDTTQENFYIGTFLAKKVEIQFRNAEDIDLDMGVVRLTIGTQIREETPTDDGYENVPIGTFYIDTTPEDYYQNARITCYDSSILFKKNVDISQWFDKDIDNNPLDISVETLLENLCEHFLGNDKLGTYPDLHKTLRTGSYDNSQSGKYYISQIAEIMGGNAKIGRDGKLYIIPLNQETPAVEIDALKSKSWTLSSKYEITGVNYENLDGIVPCGDESGNVLYIRNNNIFMNGTRESRQQIVNDLYDELNGFTIWSLKNENYGDPSLDAYDIIEFDLNGEKYRTFNDSELTYEMNIATVINVQLPSGKKQTVTNNVKGENTKINKIEQDIDQINNRITTTQTRIEVVEQDVYENSYTKSEINQLITQVGTGLTNVFSLSGGNNLLTNTVPYRYKNEDELENWVGRINGTSEIESFNKSALLLLQGTASQTVEVTQGTYAIGFKYKQLIAGATLVVRYNGREITFDNQGQRTYNNPVNLTDDGKEITSFGEITDETFTISFESSTDGGYEIYELRLVHGDIALPWTQNSNELKTKNVNIGDGITIESEQANTINNIDTDGMRIYSKTLNNYSLQTTDKGIITNDLTATGNSDVSGMLVQRVGNDHIFITGSFL